MTEAEEAALSRVLRRLKDDDYAFVMPTPRTHALVAGRLGSARRGNLRDIFGWGRPFQDDALDPPLLADLRTGGVVEAKDDRLRLTIAVSSAEGRLHLHSRPGSGQDAVFSGPDRYRFLRVLAEALRDGLSVSRALDSGTGSGVGALAIAARRPRAEVIGADVNPLALRFTALNARHAGLAVRTVAGVGLGADDGLYDLIIANPPYIADSKGFTYRDGGGLFGAERPVEWAREGVERIAAVGAIIERAR